MSRKGKGSERGEAAGSPDPGGCLEPHANDARSPPPRAEPAGPRASETLGPGRAAPEPWATWRRPLRHLPFALGAPPG